MREIWSVWSVFDWLSIGELLYADGKARLDQTDCVDEQVNLSLIEPPHDKIDKMTVRPEKTQISLGIRPVWLESSLSAWRKLGPLAAHWEHSEDSDQTGRMPRLIWVFAGCTCHFVGFDMRRLNYYLASFILPRLKWSSWATVINLNKNKTVWSPLSVTSIVKMLFMDLQGILRRLPVQAIFLIAQVRILNLLSFLLYLFIF